MPVLLVLLVLALPLAAIPAEPELEDSVRALAQTLAALEQNLAEPVDTAGCSSARSFWLR